MEWAECGDSGGFPVVVFPGYLGSIHQLRIAEPWMQSLGLRTIAVNRPGIGKSAPHRYATMAEHADDVLHLLHGIGVREFTACGISLGAGFALACADRSPDTVRSVSLISALCPLNEPGFLQTMYRSRRFALRAAHRYPDILRAALRGYCRLLRFFPSAFLRIAYKFNAFWLTADMPQYDTVKHALAEDINAALRDSADPGSIIQDLHLTSRWGFDPRLIRVPVQIWHGNDDTVVSVEGIKRFAEKLRGVTLRVVPGDHFMLIRRLPEIFGSMRLPRLRAGRRELA